MSAIYTGSVRTAKNIVSRASASPATTVIGVSTRRKVGFTHPAPITDKDVLTHIYSLPSVCNFHTSNETGYISLNRSSLQERTIETKECTWSIELLDVRKVLKLSFEQFDVPKVYNQTSQGCELSLANLTIYDGEEADEANEIGHFCYGERSVPLQHPIYSSGTQVLIRLSTRLQTPDTQLALRWEAVGSRCGGRLSRQLEGRIDYYDSHEEYNCLWYISVPPQYHIELTLARVTMPSGEVGFG